MPKTGGIPFRVYGNVSDVFERSLQSQAELIKMEALFDLAYGGETIRANVAKL